MGSECRRLCINGWEHASIGEGFTWPWILEISCISNLIKRSFWNLTLFIRVQMDPNHVGLIFFFFFILHACIHAWCMRMHACVFMFSQKVHACMCAFVFLEGACIHHFLFVISFMDLISRKEFVWPTKPLYIVFGPSQCGVGN